MKVFNTSIKQIEERFDSSPLYEISKEAADLIRLIESFLKV